MYLASDHAISVADKKRFIELVKEELGVSLIDLGQSSDHSCHYPDYAKDLCQKVLANENSWGVLICGTGIGMSMAANRHLGIRAALLKSSEDAKLSKEHNNANVLCFGVRNNSLEEMLGFLKSWYQAKFEGGRHQLRLDKF